MNDTTHSIRPRGGTNWILWIYFVSGMCSLMDEVIWVRLLKLTLGNTVYASSIVVSVFMGGLAIGAWWMSRHADRIKQRLKWYAILETIVTVTALAVPLLLAGADRFYIWFFRSYDPSRATLLAIQVLLSAVIILVPSMTMGSTLPLLGRYVTGLERESGRLVGRLYAVNTLGAAVGCFLAGFVLIRTIGVMGTLYTAAALNLCVAAAGWRLGRTAAGQDETPVEHTPVAPASDNAASGRFSLLILAFFLSGFVSIGYEIGWFRSVVFLLGGDTYVFSSVLTVYLLGNVAGAAIGSRIAGRLTNPASTFALTLGLLGLTGALYFPVLVYWTAHFSQPLGSVFSWVADHAPVTAILVKPIGHSLGLFLIPATLMGIGFPIALQAWTRNLHSVGRSTGGAYAANTIGAVIGGVVTGFLLIPRLGMEQTFSLLGGLLVLISVALFAASSPAPIRLGRLALPAVIVVIFVGLSIPANRLATLIEVSPWLNEGLETISVREGVTATVTVHRQQSNDTLHLYSSGHSIAGDNFALRGDQKALGHFGALLNPEAREVLSVGFGSGETTKCLSYHSLDRIDCVEVAPEVVESSLDHFTHLNLGQQLPEFVRMIFMDAKNYVHLTDRTYDLVVNDSIHPRDFAENASLYGKEYFEAVRERLGPRGLMVSWLPTYHMSERDFDSILGTMMDVFPHVSLWYLIQNPAPLVVLVSSEDPQIYSPAFIDESLEDPAIRDSLELIGILDATDLLNCYMGDESDLRPGVGEFVVNSDFAPFIEFSTDDWSSLLAMYQRFVVDVRSDSIFDHLDLSGLGRVAGEAWLRQFRARRESTDLLVEALATTNQLERIRLFVQGLGLAPADPALLRQLRNSEAEVVGRSEVVLELEGADRALSLADVMLAVHPESAGAWIIRSKVMFHNGDIPRAMFAARKAVELAPDNELAREQLADLTRQVGGPGD